MEYYVLVIGPYDQVFVGPFTDRDSVCSYQARLDANIFDGFVMTRGQMDENIKEFGPLPVQAPEVKT